MQKICKGTICKEREQQHTQSLHALIFIYAGGAPTATAKASYIEAMLLLPTENRGTWPRFASSTKGRSCAGPFAPNSPVRPFRSQKLSVLETGDVGNSVASCVTVKPRGQHTARSQARRNHGERKCATRQANNATNTQ